MGGSVRRAGRLGRAEERSIEEGTTNRSPGPAEKIAAAVCKDGAPVETGDDSWQKPAGREPAPSTSHRLDAPL
jgi:hypothetical protein